MCSFLDCKPVHCIVMDSLEASDPDANHTSPGDAQWHRTLVRACLKCQFHQSWPKGAYDYRAVCNVNRAVCNVNRAVCNVNRAVCNVNRTVCNVNRTLSNPAVLKWYMRPPFFFHVISEILSACFMFDMLCFFIIPISFASTL